MYGGGITDVNGILVGHAQDMDALTGVTVIRCDVGAVASVDVRGGAPGTRELALLSPECTVDRIHTVVFCGGSAYGLDACGGVMAALEERGVGLRVMPGVIVPIVAGAVLFDLGVGRSDIRPDARMGRAAVESAATRFMRGMVGVGTGATVGKLSDAPTRGGIGGASIILENGVTVGAIAAVNAAGNIYDYRTNKLIAGGAAFTQSYGMEKTLTGQNTTLVAVATNASLTKAQCRRVAMSAHDGMALAIRPAHTIVDGDTAFALATCETGGEPPMIAICSAAAEVVAMAIVNAVMA